VLEPMAACHRSAALPTSLATTPSVASLKLHNDRGVGVRGSAHAKDRHPSDR
jgi:hypothetical protein